MPLTRRQFELGIDEEGEEWMRQVYNLLADRQDLAYSSDELCRMVLGDSPELERTEKFQRALDVLAMMGAATRGQISDQDYYAFVEEFDTRSWKAAVFRL